MNVSHTTIKDKEIPRWHPLQRLALSKLSSKRFVLLILAVTSLLFFLSSSFITRTTPPDPHETDAEAAASIRKQLHSTINVRVDFSMATRPTAIFVTAHDLRNATGLTGLACDMAAAKRMNVLMVFTGGNATDEIPLFLRANGFDRPSCPIVWQDARYQYSSKHGMKGATVDLLDYAVRFVNPSVLVHVHDEEDWLMESLRESIISRRPSISIIQLKRGALHNLRWITWNKPQIDMVITTSQQNTGTLYRLLESLLSAEYLNPVLPRLFITFNPNTTTPTILHLLQRWPSDRLILRHQIAPLHTSFPGALQSWYPISNHNYALVLQDNVELSPWYMYWLHLSLMRYVYSVPAHEQPSISLLTAISLQSAPQGRSNTHQTLDIRTVLLMAPMYTGWTSYATPYIWQETLFHSTLFFPSQWKEFHTYISLREALGGGIPSATDHLPRFSSSSSEFSLENYWLELALARGYAVLYPNFDGGTSFAVQHIESHTAEMQVETPLVEWGEFFEQIDQGIPNWEDLPVLDFERRVVGWDELDRTSRTYQRGLASCKDFPEDKWDIRDLFCRPDEEGHRQSPGHDHRVLWESDERNEGAD